VWRYVALTLHAGVLGLPLLEQRPEVSGHRECARLAILCPSGAELDLVAGEVHLVPFKRQYLAMEPPAGDERELDDGLQWFRQMRHDGVHLRAVEEAGAGWSLAQHGDVRLRRELAALDC
jgi:hypothetical protein